MMICGFTVERIYELHDILVVFFFLIPINQSEMEKWEFMN